MPTPVIRLPERHRRKPDLMHYCNRLRGMTRGLAAWTRGLRPLCVVASVALGWPAAAGAQMFTEFLIPTANSGPSGITPGPDGALWFTEANGNKIGRITTAGAFSEFSIPTAASGPSGVTVGSDGALWFTELGADKIGRITTSGVITEYPVPTGAAGPNGITAGPDGALWFTEQNTNQIGRITTAGVVTEYPVPTLAPYFGMVLNGIAVGSDGALWFAGAGTNYNDQCYSFPFCLLPFIGRISTAGTITEYSMASDGFAEPYAITSGPDGALWFTAGAGQIGRITTAGNVTRYGPNTNNGGWGITTGADGALWFTEGGCIAPRGVASEGCGAPPPPAIGRITTDGVFANYAISSGTVEPVGITAGPNGTIWFTESGSGDNKIVTFAVNALLVPPTVTAIAPGRGPVAGGTSVIITGTNFTNATAVNFGSTAASSFTVNSATSITATSPAAKSIGVVDVTVTTPNGTSATSAADQFTYPPTTHDFNGDGHSDILWRDTSGDVAVWLMNGGMVSQSAASGAVPKSFSIIGQHDFDGDGKADILWRDGSGNVSMWFMNGDAVDSAAGVGDLTSNWTLYGTADLNGDGKGDLLWRDANTGTVAVWFMNGATVASTANFGAVAGNWTILGDVNGGILWRDAAGDIALWSVQNGQVTSSSGLGTVTGNFVVQGVGDFNGDGSIDILWRDTNSGALSIWFTNGTQVTSAAAVSTLPSNWNVAQIGDYNGDGECDILLIDSAGDLAVWLMNGATVSSSLPVANVGTTWQVQNVNTN